MAVMAHWSSLFGQTPAGGRSKYDVWVTSTASSKLRPVTLLEVGSDGLLLGPANRRGDLMVPIGGEGVLLPTDQFGSLWARRRHAKTRGAVIGGVVGLALGTGTAFLMGRDRNYDAGLLKITGKDQNTLLYGLLGTGLGFTVGFSAGAQRRSHYVNGNAALYEELRPQLRQYLAKQMP